MLPDYVKVEEKASEDNEQDISRKSLDSSLVNFEEGDSKTKDGTYILIPEGTGNLFFCVKKTMHSNTETLEKASIPLIQNSKKPSEEDAVFEKMPQWQKMTLYLCMATIATFQVSQNTVIFFAWEPEAIKNGLSPQTVVYIMVGQTIGSFIGQLSLKRLLSLVSRRVLWVSLMLSYCITCFIFAALPPNAISPLFYAFICSINLLIMFISMSPFRCMSVSLSSKLFPTKVGIAIQIISIFKNFGNCLGPLSVALFLQFVKLETLFHVYTTLNLIPTLIGMFLIPNISPKLRSLNSSEGISAKQLLFNWRGISNIGNNIIASLAFRVLTNYAGIFLSKKFNLSTVQISYVVELMMIGGIIEGILNVFLLKYFDHRVSQAIYSMLFCGIGHLVLGGLPGLYDPSLPVTIIGLALSRLFATAASTVNEDLTIVSEEILQCKASLKTRDTISIVNSISGSMAGLIGAFGMSIWINFLPFEWLLDLNGLVFVLLAVNYVFASRLFKAKTFLKSDRT